MRVFAAMAPKSVPPATYPRVPRKTIVANHGSEGTN